jgi:arylsulfatase A-like enzyme
VSQRPNILILTCHDIGDYLPCYGTPVHAPAFERLAREGVVFGRHFSTGTVCSPSRGSIVTGCYPHTNGLMGLVHRGWALDVDRCPPLPALLRQAGYRTHLFGIQHEHFESARLGYQLEHPVASRYAADVLPPLLAWLRNQARDQRPFICSVGLFETHRIGLMPSHFRGAGYRAASPDQVQVPAWLPDLPEMRTELAEFYGAIKTVDVALGSILDVLDASGLSENTLFIFVSDHGASFYHSKATLYDGGTKVSLLMRWPQQLEAGTRVQALTSHVDILPTLLGWLGLPVPAHVQGTDLAPVIASSDVPERSYVYAEKNYTNYYDPSRMVRSREYKYIHKGLRTCLFDFVIPELELCPLGFRQNKEVQAFYAAERTREELYDLGADPGELRNVVSDPDYAPVLAQMRDALQAHLDHTEDPYRELCNGLLMPADGYVALQSRH